MDVTLKQVEELAQRALKTDDRPSVLKALPGATRPTQLYYRFLYLVAEELKPKKILELGVWMGVSARHWLRGSRDHEGKVWGVDCNPQRVPDVVKNHPRYTFLLSESVRAAKHLVHAGPFDVVFFDTIHVAEQLNAEVVAYENLTTRPGLQIFDNLNAFDMADAWDALDGPKARIDGLSGTGRGGFGFRIMEKKRRTYRRTRKTEETTEEPNAE